MSTVDCLGHQVLWCGLLCVYSWPSWPPGMVVSVGHFLSTVDCPDQVWWCGSFGIYSWPSWPPGVVVWVIWYLQLTVLTTRRGGVGHLVFTVDCLDHQAWWCWSFGIYSWLSWPPSIMLLVIWYLQLTVLATRCQHTWGGVCGSFCVYSLLSWRPDMVVGIILSTVTVGRLYASAGMHDDVDHFVNSYCWLHLGHITVGDVDHSVYSWLSWPPGMIIMDNNGLLCQQMVDWLCLAKWRWSFCPVSSSKARTGTVSMGNPGDG